MHAEAASLGFPLWVRLTHAFNFLFLTLLIRSGIEIIGAHPKFYWSDDALPGREWIRFTKKKIPKDLPWTAEDEIEPLSSLIALPGRNNLGLGRHWHFWAVNGWMITGLFYVVLLFTSPQWRRLVPTSWEVFPAAWQAILTYTHLELPPEGNPFNAVQQISYFVLIIILSPLQILTGIAMSPALAGRFPWFPKIFGGRQAMRSFHLCGLILFLGFILIHVSLVVAHGFSCEMAKIVLGDERASHATAVAIGLSGILAVVVFHIWGTSQSLRHPFKMKKLLEIGVDPFRRFLFHHWRSRQNHERVSAYARVNGRAPRNELFQQLSVHQFKDWRLEVTGLVERPLKLSLDDLNELPRQSQTTLHTCIQGWSYFARWSGVAVSTILDQCRPLPDARYLVFHTLDEKWEKPGHGFYYAVIDLIIARDPQTILADKMNDAPLPIPYGAPLRLRTESQLGYKMAKWICRIELVKTFNGIGQGQGGWRDDVLNYYPSDAGI